MTGPSQRNVQCLRRNMSVFGAGGTDAGDHPIRLFNWMLTRCLLGQDLTEAQPALEAQIASPSLVKDERMNAERLVSLATAAALVGLRATAVIEAAIATGAQALQAYGDDDERALAAQIGALALAGDDAALSDARARRMARAPRDAAEEADTELMYLSSAQAKKDDPSTLALATASVVSAVVPGTPLTIAAPIVALLAHATRHGEGVGHLLSGKAKAVDDCLFGGSGDTPRIKYSKPTMEVTSDPEPALILISRATGSGALEVGPDPVGVFTHQLWNNVQRALDQLDRPKSSADDAAQAELALFKKPGSLHVVLALGRSVTMRAEAEAALTRRVTVAWDHARAYIEGLSASVMVEVRPQKSR